MMTSERKRIDRRQFMFLAGGVVVTGAMGGLYFVSDCPISADGFCTGPCSACYDADGNALCDRIDSLPAVPAFSVPAETAPSTLNAEPTVESNVGLPTQAAPRVVCPFGLVNDPFPGRCGRYCDVNANAICDLSEPDSASVPAGTAEPTPSPTPQLADEAQNDALDEVRVACPFGLVQDPYPGKCRKYVDSNNSGYCDYSEPEFYDALSGSTSDRGRS